MSGTLAGTPEREHPQWESSAALRDRRVAVRRLAALGSPAQDALCQALLDTNPQVRNEAARSLAEWGDARAAPALLQALQCHQSPLYRLALTTAGAAIIPLSALIDEKLPPLLVWIALGLVGTVAPVATYVGFRRFAGGVLPLVGAVVLLAERHPTDHARTALPVVWELECSLYGRARHTLNTLRVRLEHVCRRNPQLRPQCPGDPGAETAHQTQSLCTETAEALVAAYRQLRKPAERHAFLKRLDPPAAAALDVLCEALRDRTPSVRAAAAAHLGRLRDARAISPLQQALRGSFFQGSHLLERVVFGPSLFREYWSLLMFHLLSANVERGFPQLFGPWSAWWDTGWWLLFVAMMLHAGRTTHAMARREVAMALVTILGAAPDAGLANSGVRIDQLRRDLVAASSGERDTVVRQFDFFAGELGRLPIPASAPVLEAQSLPLPSSAGRPNITTDRQGETG